MTQPQGRCPKCGYLMLAAGQCPECGAEIPPGQLVSLEVYDVRASRSRWGKRFVFFLLSMALLNGGCSWFICAPLKFTSPSVAVRVRFFAASLLGPVGWAIHDGDPEAIVFAGISVIMVGGAVIASFRAPRNTGAKGMTCTLIVLWMLYGHLTTWWYVK